MEQLEFSNGNDQAKLQKILQWWTLPCGHDPVIYSISLPSGWSCPFAKECLSKADRVTGKITDGKDTEFRCSSASDESRSPQARAQRWRNFDKLRRIKTVDGMVELIEYSLPEIWDLIRVGVAGDFFNQRYFEAWLQVARNHPDQIVYAYTKSLPYWAANLGNIPPNFRFTASHGGTMDHLIVKHGMKSNLVVFNPEQAEALGRKIDDNEWHAIMGTVDYASLLHGTQPKGTTAAAAIKDMNARGIHYGYSRRKAR
mgnify:FL=1